MSWSATLVIINQTEYNITVTHVPYVTIAPDNIWTWTTAEINNTEALKFWQEPGNYYMQGSVAFGAEDGVYVDRGWQAENDQSIAMTCTVNDKVFRQTENGGATVVPRNGFESGGTITMIFQPQ